MMSTQLRSRSAVLRDTARTRPGNCRRDDITTLVLGAKRGDQAAWDALVARFGVTIRAVARRHRLSQADQDDVAQRTWLLLVEHLHSIRDPRALAQWLATTARRECLRVLEASRREIPVDDLPAEQSDPGLVHEEAARAERGAALRRAVDVLPGRQRTLMRTLLAHPNSTFDEMSSALGIPRGSLGPTHGRCVARLRRDPHLARIVG